jgi:RimJ/RimL family protein N-acetyltransferase
LIGVDPWHVAVAERGRQTAGFVITIPEFGTLWSSWIYVVPEFRRSTVGLSMIRESIAHWDHGRFHKASCYVKPENHTARTLFRRYGFREVALLRRHVLGEDFLLLELELNKTIAEYDSGVSIGRWDRLRLQLERAVGQVVPNTRAKIVSTFLK